MGYDVHDALGALAAVAHIPIAVEAALHVYAACDLG